MLNEFGAQVFVQITHLLKITDALLIDPLHDLISTERLFAHLREKLAHSLPIEIQ